MKKKIAVCIPQVPFAYGGAEIHVESLCNQLTKYGYEADLIKVPYKWYPKNKLLDNAKIWRNIDLTEINGKKIDMVIGTKFPSYGINHPNKITWLIHQFRQVYDLLNTPYSDYSQTNPKDMSIREQIIQFDQLTLSESKKIFTNSRNTANRLKKYNQLDGEVLYHPPRTAGNLHHKEYGDYILSVGRLDPLKRIDLLIKAMKYTSKHVKCVIVGSGVEEYRLKKIVEQKNLGNRIKWIPYASDTELIHLYANCFAVYYAPFDEDYGYVTLEAFLSRKPVITLNDSGGVLEFVSHQQNGFILTSQPDQIGNSIENLFHNRQKQCFELGEAGYSTVKDITWEHVITKLTETLV